MRLASCRVPPAGVSGSSSAQGLQGKVGVLTTHDGLALCPASPGLTTPLAVQVPLKVNLRPARKRCASDLEERPVASVDYRCVSWASIEQGEDMAPGDVHKWWANPFRIGDALSFTAYATGTRYATDLHSTLAVEDVQMDGVPNSGYTVLFSVRNAGNTFIVSYFV